MCVCVCVCLCVSECVRTHVRVRVCVCASLCLFVRQTDRERQTKRQRKRQMETDRDRNIKLGRTGKSNGRRSKHTLVQAYIKNFHQYLRIRYVNRHHTHVTQDANATRTRTCCLSFIHDLVLTLFIPRCTCMI